MVSNGGDGARGRKRETAGEDREASQNYLLRLAEQTVAPIERGGHGAMPRRGRAATARQQPQALLEARRNPPNPESLDTGRRVLDRERQPVELSANVADKRGIGIAQREFVQARRRALDEQLNRRESRSLRRR